MCLLSSRTVCSLSAIDFFVWNADSTTQVDDTTVFLLVLLTKCYLREKIVG